MLLELKRLRASILIALACASGTTGAQQEPGAEQLKQYWRPATVPFPADNPYSPQKVLLGKMLFFDTRLSRDSNLNCASCHSPSFGWEVPFSTAIGAGGRPLGRHAPTVLNQAWGTSYFWDGRAPTLEAQAAGPIEAPVEMDLPLPKAVERLQAVEGYRKAFDAAFPNKGITADTITKALATFQRTLVTPDTPFDRWVRGDKSAISDSAKRGFSLFVGKARCANCHVGWNFTDGKFHDIGLPTDDVGRAGVTGNAADTHAFKTPSLREIAARAPYMHKGQISTLEGVVMHYVSGGVDRPTRSAFAAPIPLNNEEVKDLLGFLQTLSSTRNGFVLPQLPSR